MRSSIFVADGYLPDLAALEFAKYALSKETKKTGWMHYATQDYIKEEKARLEKERRKRAEQMQRRRAEVAAAAAAAHRTADEGSSSGVNDYGGYDYNFDLNDYGSSSDEE